MTLDLDRLRAANVSRVARWHEEVDWTGADWSNAMCGEAGEAANIVKKIRRVETSVNQPGPSIAELVPLLAKELADIVCYCDLLAVHYDIDLSEAIIQKFNEVSERYDFPERI